MTEPIVACTLSACDYGAQAARWQQLRSQAQRSRTETEDGLRLTFEDGSDVRAELDALVAVERECCSWATWEVRRERGELVLEARSSGHGAAALHDMLV